jgi:capsular polysaccharide biosynthesis protein
VELTDLFRIIWKRRWVVLVVLVATVALGVVFVSRSAKLYESTATLALTPNAAKGPANSLPPSAVASLVQTYAVTAKSASIVRVAEATLGYPLPGTLITSPRLETGILDISDRARSPHSASAAATAVATAFTESLKGNTLVEVQIVNPAVADGTPVQPRTSLVIAIAIILGLIAGCMLALAANSFREHPTT